ncbi:MAG: hypothetical protein GXO00_02560 [Candidatus Diapherotrites archaeon]|nr:hypothetical protein [Candidatus Diapherotrites archaeon]
MEFRLPSLEERRRFYLKHFDYRRAVAFVKRHDDNPVFAVKLGANSGIYDPRFEEKIRRRVNVLFLGPLLERHSPRELGKVFARYAPEGVYYWRNRVREYALCRVCPHKRRRDYSKCFSCSNFRGQELAFDVDADVNGDLKGAARATDLIHDELPYREKVRVFSGRGFHVHVFDEEAYALDLEERKKLAKRFERYIDPWVTAGNATLIRLPYTLNGLSGTVVLPLPSTATEFCRQHCPENEEK